MKSAMITGAGSGLGRASALALAARGCALVLVDIDKAATAKVARECGNAQVLLQDLTAPGGAEAAVLRSIVALGELSIVVNNAGYGAGEAFLDMREATWDRTLDLNLKAVALICAARVGTCASWAAAVSSMSCRRRLGWRCRTILRMPRARPVWMR